MAPAFRVNQRIAREFDQVADLLAMGAAPARRSGIYRRGAVALRRLSQPVTTILHTEGLAGLIRVAAIGEKLARAVRRSATTGELPILIRLTSSRSTVGGTPQGAP